MLPKRYIAKYLIEALENTKQEINERTRNTPVYKRGFNDCFAMVMVYDEKLRGYTKSKEIVDFEWESPKEFISKLKRKGYSLTDFATYCGYTVVTSKRPELGDIAFENGSAMIADKDHWISTSEINDGVQNKRQIQFLERNVSLIARPIRS